MPLSVASLNRHDWVESLTLVVSWILPTNLTKCVSAKPSALVPKHCMECYVISSTGSTISQLCNLQRFPSIAVQYDINYRVIKGDEELEV